MSTYDYEDNPYADPTIDPSTGLPWGEQPQPLPGGTAPGAAPGTVAPQPGQTNFAPGTGPVVQIPTTTNASGTPIGPSAGYNGNFKDTFQSWTNGKAPTQAELVALEPYLKAFGSKLSPANANGEITKIWDPSSNQWVRVGFGGNKWDWVPQGDGSQPSTLGGIAQSSLIDPYGGQPPPGWAPPAGSDVPGAFSFPQFTAPTGADANNEPGYQFSRDQAEQALQQSASGKGLLRTGGTLKDIIAFGNKYAEQNYNNVFNRALSTFNTNFPAAKQTYDTNLTRSEDVYNRGWNEYKQGYNQFKDWQNSTFDKLYKPVADTTQTF